MITKRLYRDNVYLREAEAVVTAVEGKVVEFDQTVFFPEGGGQSCDRGTIDGFEVSDVQEDGDRVLHTVEGGSFAVGQKVSMALDWDYRFDNMQRHCGEHIVSGVIFKEYGGANKGFHMGEDYMTIDMDLSGTEYSEITWEMANHIEQLANDVIWRNVPVQSYYFDTKQEAEQMPLRKDLKFEKDVSVVLIGTLDQVEDCVNCCGTHPSTSGQVGLVKIYKLEQNKGMTRLYLEAGKRAFLDYEKKHRQLLDMSLRYSTGIDELDGKLRANDAEMTELYKKLNNMRRIIFEQRIEDVRTEVESAPADQHIVVREYADLSPDDVMKIGKPFIDTSGKLVILAASADKTLFLFSDGKAYDCGRLVKENAGIYGGKGGGRPNNARAVFPNREGWETYIDLLEKHLR